MTLNRRRFIGTSAAAFSLTAPMVRAAAHGKPKVVVIGGGAGGATAARYISKDSDGAIDALEQVYQNDSTKTDSLYFLKVMVFADEQPDTARLLKWARIGVDKYPANVNLFGFLAKGYGLVGELDSALAVTSHRPLRMPRMAHSPF